MKKKKLNKKLFLNKETISNLNEIKGGNNGALADTVSTNCTNNCPTGSAFICCATGEPGTDLSGCACC